MWCEFGHVSLEDLSALPRSPPFSRSACRFCADCLVCAMSAVTVLYDCLTCAILAVTALYDCLTCAILAVTALYDCLICAILAVTVLQKNEYRFRAKREHHSLCYAYTEVYSVIYDFGPVPEWSIISPLVASMSLSTTFT